MRCMGCSGCICGQACNRSAAQVGSTREPEYATCDCGREVVMIVRDLPRRARLLEFSRCGRRRPGQSVRLEAGEPRPRIIETSAVSAVARALAAVAVGRMDTIGRDGVAYGLSSLEAALGRGLTPEEIAEARAATWAFIQESRDP